MMQVFSDTRASTVPEVPLRWAQHVHEDRQALLLGRQTDEPSDRTGNGGGGGAGRAVLLEIPSNDVLHHVKERDDVGGWILLESSCGNTEGKLK